MHATLVARQEHAVLQTHTPQLHITVSILSILFHPCFVLVPALALYHQLIITPTPKEQDEWPTVHVTEGVADELRAYLDRMI